jgi:pimeloyl-ACP methyl ester carboxylesterase
MASDDHARWLDDIWNALDIKSANIVGASLGGWFALDYAIRRTARVRSLALLAPAGVVAMRLGFLLRVAPLMLLGPWGHRRALRLDMGFDPNEEASAEGKAFVDLFRLAQQHYVGRMKPIPTFPVHMLCTVKMPVIAIIGGSDAFFDSEKMKRRLKACLPDVEVNYLPEAGHGLVDPTLPVLEFLRRANAWVRTSIPD